MQQKQTLRQIMYDYMEPGESGNQRGETLVDGFIIALILLNVAAIILESMPSLNARYGTFFNQFELFSVTIFTIEYLLRLWTAVEMPNYSHPIKGRINYFFTTSAIIDLLAILPFYLFFLPIDLRFLRGLRAIRLFRIFKLARYVHALKVFHIVIYQRREQLILSFVFIMVMLITASSLMYYIESEEQPESFTSIPATMWWGIATITTVGYGDMYPMTTLGRFLGGLIAITGIAMFALPAGIISSGLTEYLQTTNKEKKCKHCGELLND
jgi:voltage-gated potassium channel